MKIKFKPNFRIKYHGRWYKLSTKAESVLNTLSRIVIAICFLLPLLFLIGLCNKAAKDAGLPIEYWGMD